MKSRGNSRGILKHTAISASAGSGKTFKLAHRYLALMAEGVHPDRIIAMTFSRKAAGEIFDEIVKYLCRAAGSDVEARKTAAEIGRPSSGAPEFLRMLRQLTEGLHRTHIGTLDSFTVGVIRAFPLELGIASDFQVMDSDGAEARSVRHEILCRIFSHPRIPESTRREFLEAFKQATFGQEEKGLERNLDRFVLEHRSKYQAVPEADAWCRPERIWPEPPDWLAPEKKVKQAADNLLERIAKKGWPDRVMDRWRTFCGAVPRFGFESPWTRDVEYLFEKLAAVLESVRRGEATVRIEKEECLLSCAECRLALSLFRHIMHIEVTRSLTRTRGLFNILEQYEQLYDMMARRRGRLTFDDVQFMLTEANLHSNGNVLSRQQEQPAKLYIDYRLDCQLDHWLLDEFQDTSDLQWQALQNLADEVLQDDGRQRTFFYVGDVKQAIYGWRGGNARLFEKVRRQYRDRITSERLDASYRSCAPVIETVNSLFADLPQENLPAGALSEWAGIWRTHTCAEPLADVSGHAALLEPRCDGGATKPADEDRFRVVASLIGEIAPLQRGLSVAVLVRTNDAGRKVVDFLRRECKGLTVVHEGRAPIADNPVVAALLSLVKLAEHPGDEFARQHVRMTPLGPVLEEQWQVGPRGDDFSLRLPRQIHAEGFQGFVRHWGRALDRVSPLDDFGRLRLNDLIDAAAVFDAEGGNRSCGDFLRFINNHDIRDLAAEGAVTVMTVHQAKGLGFDVVILPDLMGGSFAKARAVGLAARRDPATNRPLWFLEMPRRVVSESDEVLRDALQRCDEDACFEELCVLYVAMTRARRGLYMITAFPGKFSKAVTAAALVKTQLAGDPKPVTGVEVDIAGMACTQLYEAGRRDWYRDVPIVKKGPVTPAPALPADFDERPSQRTRLVRVAPSLQDEIERNAGWLFAGESREVLDFGRAIHELFEAVEWIEHAQPEAIISDWLPSSQDSAEVKRDVCEQFRNALAAEEIRRDLSRPEADVELWREKRFEIVIDGRWVTGSFDRVVISRDATGKPRGATIVDYKSNRVETDAELAETAERYRPQLELYGKALSRILNLRSSAIGLHLLFTRAGRVSCLDNSHPQNEHPKS